jgi:regulator of protease activity HflC (stomatin/prohibitin superfamily)
MLDIAPLVLTAIVLRAIVTMAQGVRIVPQGEIGSVERFGAFMRLRQPPPDLIIPGEPPRPNRHAVVLDIPETMQEAGTRISPGARRS